MSQQCRTWVLIGLFAAIPVAAPEAAGKDRAEPARTTSAGYVKKFQVTAVDGELRPAEITIGRGDRVSITFKSLDGTYRLRMKEFGIRAEFRKGNDVTIEIVATERGEYPFRCTRGRSVKRWSRNGTIVVK